MPARRPRMDAGNKGVRIVKKDGAEQLEFDPRNRWEMLKLLNDDYLGSVMTSGN